MKCFIANKYQGWNGKYWKPIKNVSFKLTTFKNLHHFYNFDQSLKDKVIEDIVREFIFTVYLRLSVPWLSILLLWIRTHIIWKNINKCSTCTSFLRRKIQSVKYAHGCLIEALYYMLFWLVSVISHRFMLWCIAVLILVMSSSNHWDQLQSF